MTASLFWREIDGGFRRKNAEFVENRSRLGAFGRREKENGGRRVLAREDEETERSIVV